MNNTFKSALGWVRHLAVMAAALAGTAHAAVYSGVWDPAYGSPFTGLGWRGTATYFVPDSCEPGGTAIIYNSPTCSGNAAVTSAQVVLYDDTMAGDPPVATLNFTPSSMVIGTMSFVSGDLKQLTTGVSNYINPTEDLSAFGVGSGVEFALFFDMNEDPALSGPRLLWRDCTCLVAATAYYDNDGPRCVGGINDAAQFPPQFEITRVPEPGTLALVGAAFVVFGGRRVRKALGHKR